MTRTAKPLPIECPPPAGWQIPREAAELIAGLLLDCIERQDAALADDHIAHHRIQKDAS